MTLKFIGRKKGMAQLFDDKGNLIVCTIISAEPNVIAQIKSKQTDGYEALQLGGIQVKPSKVKNVSKALKGHFSKSGINPRKYLKESRLKNVDDYKVGQEIGVDYFADISYVDVIGVSKGKGYQGVIKRHGFAGGPASHGSGFHRHAGSTGMRSSPGRCLPGVKKAGRMGGEQVTLENLKVVKVDAEKQVIIVRGAVPGPNEGLVYVSKAKKKNHQSKSKK
ncbi:MAG: 50S ribosomal protein L3 [Anaerolineae bacterium]